MPRYVRHNPLKQTLDEDMRLAPGSKVLVLWFAKLFRNRLQFMSPSQIPVPFHECVVEPEAVPREAVQQLLPLLQQAATLGFDPPVYLMVRSMGGESVGTAANCRHAGGEIIARLTHVRVGNVHPPKEKTVFNVISLLADGRRLVTTGEPAKFTNPPELIVQRKIGATFAQLLALHEQKLKELRPVAPPHPIPDNTAMGEVCDEFELKAMEFHIRRGVYEEVPPEEVAAHAARAAAQTPVAIGDLSEAALLNEIERLQNKRRSWQSAIVIGVISLVVFILAGKTRWNAQVALILTGVIMFHEAGHYVAMRLLKYKDLRVFFVPLLGAAVTGRHYNVKGWQKAVVYLAGPVPGILVGAVLAVVALITHNPLVEKTALMALILNGINLLPFVPLDGGWVLHALIFSRHFVLETVFMAFAGLSLLGASMLTQSKFWMYLGIAILVGLPASYRIAQVAARLKKSGIANQSPDDQTVPPETALTIFRELQKVKVKATSRLTKQLAAQTLEIFQKLNATPPGLPATVLLLMLYIGAGTAALVGTGMVIFARSGALRSAIEHRLPKPTYALDAETIQTAGNTNDATWNWQAPVLVAAFTNTSHASAAFDEAAQKASSNERVLLIGQTVFFSGTNLSTNSLPWNPQHQAFVFLEQPASNLTAEISLSCRAPDAATANDLVSECRSYFSDSWLHLLPPWTSPEKLEPAQEQVLGKTRHRK